MAISFPAIWSKLGRKFKTRSTHLRDRLDKRFNQITYEIIWVLYSHPLSWRYRWLLPIAHQFQLVGKFLFKSQLLHIRLVEGINSDGGNKLRLFYFGPGTSYAWFVFRLFGDRATIRTDLGTCRSSNLRRESRRLAEKTDLIVIERNSLLRWKPHYGTWIVMPESVHMVMDFAHDQTWDQVEKIFNRTMEYNIRKVRKAGFQLSMGKLPEGLERFYRNMYYPYTTYRHKDHAQLASLEYMQGFLGHAELKQVCLPDGRVLAGYFCQRRGRVMHWLYNGVLDGDPRWMQQGALSALYYLGIRKDFEQGIQRVNIGGVIPFEEDSLYQHKKRWGFHPEKNPWSYTDWLIWAPDETSVAAEWIKGHLPLEGVASLSKNISEVA